MNADQPCAGKIVLVTGAQRGIGSAIALRFAAAGADVALNFLDDKAAAESVAAYAISSSVNTRVRNRSPNCRRDSAIRL